MSIRKHNWQFQCFRENSFRWVIYAVRPSDGSVLVCWANTDGYVGSYHHDENAPDVRLLHYTEFGKIPPKVRALVRHLVSDVTELCACTSCQLERQGGCVSCFFLTDELCTCEDWY